MSLHLLACHPDTPCAGVERVEVELDRSEPSALRLSYRMIGDARSVLATPPSPGAAPRRRDELWRHTCCELFLGDAAGTAYREYNFAPCGDWAAYGFDDYRAGRVSLDLDPPRIVLERTPARLALTVTLADRLDARVTVPRIGIACVIETAAGLSYWALTHPPGRPDFHHARAFAPLPAIEHTASASA